MKRTKFEMPKDILVVCWYLWSDTIFYVSFYVEVVSILYNTIKYVKAVDKRFLVIFTKTKI